MERKITQVINLDISDTKREIIQKKKFHDILLKYYFL